YAALLTGRALVVDKEDGLGVAALAEADLIAVRERPLGDALAVDERAEPRLLVANDAGAVLRRNLGVHARDVGAWQPQIGFAAASDREQRLVNRHDPAAECVGDDETWCGNLGHAGSAGIIYLTAGEP